MIPVTTAPKSVREQQLLEAHADDFSMKRDNDSKAGSFRELFKTKIVATIGPASSSAPMLKSMIEAGMSVARLNFSHGEFQTHSETIDRIRAVANAVRRRVTIMADLPGPKIRIGKLASERISLTAHQSLILTTSRIIGDQSRISVSFKSLPKVLKPGDFISLNDGYIQLEVTEVRNTDVLCLVKVGGELRSFKGLNLPGINLGVSAFTRRDRECLEFAKGKSIEAVSQSFVGRAKDLHDVRKAARKLRYDPFLIAKIERSNALDRLEEILEAADGVMVARGDLGVEIPIERIGVVQKEIIRQANRLAKPVITATQMLESMTTYRLPTRAETTDVSNAILDGTDCVMLSGESAVGAYPLESVEMLARIATFVEPTRPRVSPVEKFTLPEEKRLSILPEHLIALSIETSVNHLRPAAVFVSSVTGSTARRLASMHLPVPIVAVSPERTYLSGSAILVWRGACACDRGALLMEHLGKTLGTKKPPRGRICDSDRESANRPSSGQSSYGDNQFMI